MISISNTEADVHAKHAAINSNANNSTSTKEVDGKLEQVRNPAPSNSEKLLLAKDLKELISFRELLESDKHVLRKSGSYYMCRCPFHSDKTPSFAVREDDDTTGKCFGCNWYGNIFDYEMEFHRVDFRTAWERLNDFYYKSPRKGTKAKTEKQTAAASPLTEGQLAERKKYAQRLATDAWIASRICQLRWERSGNRWNPKTLQGLGREGSLGWAGDALAFIYPTGTKYRRWPDKEFIWECEGISLWRGHLLTEAAHIYLTESETDAIALIDAGLENNPGVAVVAAPSATSFKKEWAEHFQDKVVIFCFDADEAGEEALKRIAILLHPYAKQMSTVDLKEVK